MAFKLAVKTSFCLQLCNYKPKCLDIDVYPYVLVARNMILMSIPMFWWQRT